MKFIGEQISFVESDTKTTILIIPKTSGIFKALFGAWVAMWIVIGIAAVWGWFTFVGKDKDQSVNNQQEIIMWVFMAFWTYYFIRVIRSFLWVMFGREFIKIDKISLSMKRGIGQFGKMNEYFLENITKMEMHLPKERSIQQAYENSPWIQGGERIQFDYLTKTFRFGRKLNEKDSKLLFQFVTKKVEFYQKKNKS
jgi:hypothetical protein